MAIDIFEPLKDLQGNKQKSASWYRNAVSLIADRSSPSELFASGKLLGRPSAGRMSMFFYDPKFKTRLLKHCNRLLKMKNQSTHLISGKVQTLN